MDSFIIYWSAIDAPLNLNYIILKEMVDVRNHKNRALPFGALLTKISRHLELIDGGFFEHMIRRGISIDTSEEE